MNSSKNKIFQDTVHGYITIPKDYCTDIIDTPIFQRLRRIEQTSIRSLYPCAHHERFVHSLGTYYLGDKIFDQVMRNLEHDPHIKELLTDDQWEKLRETYRLACLLHDCGHSPFSHTLEKYYDKYNDLNGILLDETKGAQSFHEDFSIHLSGKPHEKVSAIVLLREYRSVLVEQGADPILAVRMIIGCLILEPKDDFEKIANCFITLLNGGIIDADRLDYSKRDVFSSGYSTVKIDFDRLISAICIKKDPAATMAREEYKVCFHKGAILEIPRILQIKDFQTSWVFSHHKTIYDQHLIEKSVEKLCEIIADRSGGTFKWDDIFRQLFDINSFFGPCPLGDDDTIYLLADGDLVYLLKKYMADNAYAQEWLSRSHRLKPL